LVSGLKVSPQNANLIYTGSLDQTIKLWDLRTGSVQKPASTFTETTTGKMINGKRGKPLTAFDVNCDDRFLAAGTEQVQF
jgi:WD40 repeat protein